MEPLASLKRQSSTDATRCIICQEDKTERLVEPTAQGLAKVKETAQIRLKHSDQRYHAAINRIVDSDVLESEQSTVIWHKSCYSSFTSKSNLLWTEPRGESGGYETSASSSNQPVELRSSVQPMDWETCIFCQNDSDKTKLSSVTTFKMSQHILEASKYDQHVSIRLPGVNV